MTFRSLYHKIALRCNPKPRTIGARPHSYHPFKCSTKSICAFESNRGTDALNAGARNLQSSLRFSDTSTCDKLRGCLSESILEQTSEIARRHACLLGERLDRKILIKVTQNP